MVAAVVARATATGAVGEVVLRVVEEVLVKAGGEAALRAVEEVAIVVVA